MMNEHKVDKCPLGYRIGNACINCDYTQRIGFCWYPQIVCAYKMVDGMKVVVPLVEVMHSVHTWPELEIDYERRANAARHAMELHREKMQGKR